MGLADNWERALRGQSAANAPSPAANPFGFTPRGTTSTINTGFNYPSPMNVTPVRTTPTTGSSSRPAAIAAGRAGGNRSSTTGSGSTIRTSGATNNPAVGGTPGETNRFRNIQQSIITTPTGAVVGTEETPAPGDNGGSGGSGGAGDTGGGTPAPVQAAPTETAPAAPTVDAAAELDAAINALLEGDWIGFQGDRAAELRRLQNLRNQLFGDTEFGTTGSVQRQEGLDTQARRRLAAQRAMAGMLQGGAYAGTERGLGTIQRAEQDYAMQEMLRPFREQTAADRLAEFGLTFDPTGRIFNLSDFGNADDMMGGWSTSTWAGREAQARARAAALQQLAQRGIQI